MLCFVVQTRVVLLNWCAWFLRMRRPRRGAHPSGLPQQTPSARERVQRGALRQPGGAAAQQHAVHRLQRHGGSPLHISPRFTRHALRTNHGLRRGRRAAARGDHALARGRGRNRGAGQWWHCGRGFGIGTGSDSGGGAIHR